jgi:hypothetical protein
MTPDDEFTRRRKSRALVTALILGGFVVLFYFMTIAKITGQ